MHTSGVGEAASTIILASGQRACMCEVTPAPHLTSSVLPHAPRCNPMPAACMRDVLHSRLGSCPRTRNHCRRTGQHCCTSRTAREGCGCWNVIAVDRTGKRGGTDPGVSFVHMQRLCILQQCRQRKGKRQVALQEVRVMHRGEPK